MYVSGLICTLLNPHIHPGLTGLPHLRSNYTGWKTCSSSSHMILVRPKVQIPWLCFVRSRALPPHLFLSLALSELGEAQTVTAPVVHLLPQGRKAEVMKQLLVGMLNETRAHTHSACLNSYVWDLSCREVADCSTSLLIRMPLLCLWGLCFSGTLPGFAWFPHLVLICSVVPQRNNSAFMGLSGKNSRMPMQFEVSSIWVSFILKLASGLFASPTIKIM